MPYTILCVVGGVTKRRDKKLLPARVRYKGVHIQRAKEAAFARGNLPWFVLSSKFGIVAEGQGVVDYRHSLIERDLDILVNLLYTQLGQMRAREVYFYTFAGDEWRLYLRAMTLATQKLGARLITTELEEPSDA